MKHLKHSFYFLVLLICLAPAAVLAQDDQCPDIVQDALETADAACRETTGRNQACYGNIFVEAESKPDVSQFSFERVGDMVDVSALSSLSLNAMDVDSGEWGVALMRIQPILEGTLPGQNVTFLLFGDVEIIDASGEAIGEFGPMQAFYFRSGIGDAPCEQAPDSGILVQTPEGETEITLNVNGADVVLSSTAFLQAAPPSMSSDDETGDGQLIFNLLEGAATVEADGVEQTLAAGERVTVPIDENLQVSGAPSEPEPYDASAFGTLPLSLLQREFDLAGAEGTGDLSAAPAGTIPLSGTWTYSADALTFSGSCPPGMDQAMEMAMPGMSGSTDITWGGEFGAEALEGMDFGQMFQMTAQQSGLPDDMTIESPEPNVVVLSMQGVVIEYRLVNEALFTATMQITTEGCTINITMHFEHQG